MRAPTERRRGRTRVVAALATSVAMLALTTDTGCKRLRHGPDVTWHLGLANGEAAVQKQHKPAVLFFGAEWNTASKELARETFADRDVRERIDHDFVAVSIDVSDDERPETRAAQRRFDVQGVPTVIIVASDFRTELRRWSSFIEPRDLLASLEATRTLP